MIPSINTILNTEIEVEEEPSLTYRMNLNRETVQGQADGQEAMKQAIFKILNTERYQHIIYSWNYGIELLDLYGKRYDYAVSELERRIEEALLQDNRIKSVDNFKFSSEKRGSILTTFTVHTTFGDIEAERLVNI